MIERECHSCGGTAKYWETVDEVARLETEHPIPPIVTYDLGEHGHIIITHWPVTCDCKPSSAVVTLQLNVRGTTTVGTYGAHIKDCGASHCADCYGISALDECPRCQVIRAKAKANVALANHGIKPALLTDVLEAAKVKG